MSPLPFAVPGNGLPDNGLRHPSPASAPFPAHQKPHRMHPAVPSWSASPGVPPSPLFLLNHDYCFEDDSEDDSGAGRFDLPSDDTDSTATTQFDEEEEERREIINGSAGVASGYSLGGLDSVERVDSGEDDDDSDTDALLEVESVLMSLFGDARSGKTGGVETPLPVTNTRGDDTDEDDCEELEDDVLEVGTPTQKSAFSSNRLFNMTRTAFRSRPPSPPPRGTPDHEEDDGYLLTLSPSRLAADGDFIPPSPPLPMPSMPVSSTDIRPPRPRLEPLRPLLSSSSPSPLIAPILGASSSTTCLLDLSRLSSAHTAPLPSTTSRKPNMSLGPLPPPPLFPPINLDQILSPDIIAPLHPITSPNRNPIRPILKRTTSSDGCALPNPHATPPPLISPQPALDFTRTSWSSSSASTLCGDSGPPSPTLSSAPATTPTTPRRSDSGKSLTFDTQLERVCLFNIEDDPLQVGRNRAGELVYVDELSEVDEEEEDGSGSEDEGNKSMAGAIWFSTPKPTAPPPPKHWALLSRSTPATNTAFSSGANVCLDAVRLDDTTDPSNPSLSGAILVRNLAFSKRVLVRHTSDNWSTFYDLPATFAGTVVPTMAGFVGIDRFTFRLPVGQPPLTAPGALPPTREVVLAVSCTMDGREHWDNNAGANHAFHLGLREVMDHGRGRRKAEAVEELLRRARAGSEAALRAAVNSGQAMAVEARLIAEQFGREKKPWQVMTRGGAGGGGGVATGGHAQPQQVAPGYGGDEDGRRWSFSGLANDGGGSARDVGPVRAASFDRPVSADPPAMEKPRRPTSLPSMTAVDGFGGRKRGGGFTLKGTKGGLTKRLGNVDRSPSPPPVPFGGGWKGGFEGVGIGMMMKWGEKAEKGNK